MIVRTGLGQALACPPGATDPSCAASPVFERKPPVYAPSAEMLQIQKAGLDVPDTTLVDSTVAAAKQTLQTAGWGMAAIAVVIILMIALSGRRR